MDEMMKALNEPSTNTDFGANVSAPTLQGFQAPSKPSPLSQPVSEQKPCFENACDEESGTETGSDGGNNDEEEETSSAASADQDVFSDSVQRQTGMSSTVVCGLYKLRALSVLHLLLVWNFTKMSVFS